MKIVNVNVVGTLNVTSTIFPLMAARKKGHVVNMSSTMVSNVIISKYELENKPHFVRVLLVWRTKLCILLPNILLKDCQKASEKKDCSTELRFAL